MPCKVRVQRRRCLMRCQPETLSARITHLQQHFQTPIITQSLQPYISCLADTNAKAPPHCPSVPMWMPHMQSRIMLQASNTRWSLEILAA